MSDNEPSREQPAPTAMASPASSRDVQADPTTSMPASPSSPLPPDPFPDPPPISSPTALETAQWWADSTSIHGMPYMLDRGHYRTWKATIWTIFVLGMAGGLLWALIAEVQDFKKFNVDTSTATVIPPSLEFPRVTICNANGGIDAGLQNATGIVEPRNEEELGRIAQPLEEFIWYTQFNNEVYQAAEELAAIWTPVITPLGRCFRFATNDNVFVPGTSAGLRVYTWLDQASYPATAVWAGVRVFVASRGGYSNDGTSVSNQTSGAIFVPPGAVSFVAVTRQDFQREEEEPWSHCIPGGHDVDQCRMECIMLAMKEKCGCRIMGDGSDADRYDYCTSENDSCTSTIGDEDLGLCQICAIPPCQERVYRAKYSAGRVSRRTEEYAEAVHGASAVEVHDNFVAIHVNYDSIRYDETTESKSTSVSQMISNLGGSFGFFMGISLISIVELFVELLGLRLLPRLWGEKKLYGIGQRKYD